MTSRGRDGMIERCWWRRGGACGLRNMRWPYLYTRSTASMMMRLSEMIDDRYLRCVRVQAMYVTVTVSGMIVPPMTTCLCCNDHW